MSQLQEQFERSIGLLNLLTNRFEEVFRMAMVSTAAVVPMTAPCAPTAGTAPPSPPSASASLDPLPMITCPTPLPSPTTAFNPLHRENSCALARPALNGQAVSNG